MYVSNQSQHLLHEVRGPECEVEHKIVKFIH